MWGSEKGRGAERQGSLTRFLSETTCLTKHGPPHGEGRDRRVVGYKISFGSVTSVLHRRTPRGCRGGLAGGTAVSKNEAGKVPVKGRGIGGGGGALGESLKGFRLSGLKVKLFVGKWGGSRMVKKGRGVLAAPVKKGKIGRKNT